MKVTVNRFAKHVSNDIQRNDLLFLQNSASVRHNVAVVAINFLVYLVQKHFQFLQIIFLRLNSHGMQALHGCVLFVVAA